MKRRRDKIDIYINGGSWRSKPDGSNENANRLRSIGGLKAFIAENEVARHTLKYVYPPEISRAHVEGFFHIHDLGSGIVPYCAGWSLQDLLLNGFSGVGGVVQSRPPKHFSSALGQLLNAVGVVQQEWAGAMAYNSVDTLLAPFIRRDGLSYQQVAQYIQEFVHSINVPTRWGFETPFLNFSFDLEPPEDLMNQGVVIGGKMENTVYGDYQEEMDIFNRAFLEVMYRGDANSSIFKFPIPTYMMSENSFDWDSDVGQWLAKATAKFGLPYFQNCSKNTGLNPRDVRSMCCHLNLDLKELRRKTGGLFGSGDTTGSVGVVTLNLARIAYLAKDEDRFFEMLWHYMNLAKESLEIKRKICNESFKKGLMPFSRIFLRHLEDDYLRNHFSTIGVIAGEEACRNLLGRSIADEEGLRFMIKVLNFIRKGLLKFQEETGNLWNLEATPAEGASYRLARIDARTLDKCYVSGTRKDPYYTNSTQLPVDYTHVLGKAVRHQEQLQSLYTGGTVFHMYLPERPDERVIPFLIQRMIERTRIPYFTITPTFSICRVCHQYLPGEQPVCPFCGGQTDIFTRIVGYYAPLGLWNKGKKQEWKARVAFDPSSFSGVN